MTKTKTAKKKVLMQAKRATPSVETLRIELEKNKVRNRTRGRKSAPVAYGQAGLGNQTDGIVVTGRDRFTHVADVSTFEPQTVIIDDIFASNSTARLDTLGNAYTKWDVISLVFHIEPQISTAVSGGYVAGFDMDPDSVIPDGDAGLNAITALAGSVTKKWWEGGTVSMQRSKIALFTVSNENEIRWSSPGKFLLASDGKATTPGSLTIYVEWTVRFSKPQLQTQVVEPDPIHPALLPCGVWHDDTDATFVSAVHETTTEQNRVTLERAFPDLPLADWATANKIMDFGVGFPLAKYGDVGVPVACGFTPQSGEFQHHTGVGVVLKLFNNVGEPAATAGGSSVTLGGLQGWLTQALWVKGQPFNYFDFKGFVNPTKRGVRKSFRCYNPLSQLTQRLGSVLLD